MQVATTRTIGNDPNQVGNHASKSRLGKQLQRYFMLRSSHRRSTHKHTKFKDTSNDCQRSHTYKRSPFTKLYRAQQIRHRGNITRNAPQRGELLLSGLSLVVAIPSRIGTIFALVGKANYGDGITAF